MNPIANLLGLSKIGYPKASELKTMITLGGYNEGEDSLPMLIPVMCSSKQFDLVRQGMSRYVETLAFFPPEFGWNVSSRIHTKIEQLKETEIPCLAEDFAYFEADSLDVKKLSEWRDLASKRGGVFFKFSNVKMLPSLQFLSTIKRKFVHNAVFCDRGNPTWFLGGENKGDFELFVSFIDMKNAIPVFDIRSADGLAVVISLLKGKSRLHDIAILFSNNRKNLFFVDGQRINEGATELTFRKIAVISKKIRELIATEPKTMEEKMKREKKSKGKNLSEMYGSLGVDFEMKEGVELDVKYAKDMPEEEIDLSDPAEPIKYKHKGFVKTSSIPDTEASTSNQGIGNTTISWHWINDTSASDTDSGNNE